MKDNFKKNSVYSNLLILLNCKNPKNINQIREGLRKHWNALHQKTPDFYIYFGNGWNDPSLEDTLLRLEDTAILKFSFNKGKLYYKLTERGSEIIRRDYAEAINYINQNLNI